MAMECKHRWKQVAKIFYKNGKFKRGVFECLVCGNRKQMTKSQTKEINGKC